MRRSIKSRKAAAALAHDLALAPAVIALRLPLLAAEAGSKAMPRESIRSVTEKAAALTQGTVAAQMSLAVSASRFWLELLTGQTPSILNGVALERAAQAALAPSSKAVRKNFGRLSRRPR
ncbi:MAG: hypothetical protein KF849_09565 [Rhizobiaceae bacterium]|nr:hypothetical protein [Rhizobiaceae bacterium]